MKKKTFPFLLHFHFSLAHLAFCDKQQFKNAIFITIQILQLMVISADQPLLQLNYFYKLSIPTKLESRCSSLDLSDMPDLA